ncbi:IS110 family transposase [Alicyclobacillus cellulosilyticus]|uniref:IS110 family transposase n=1 Tax=Alicyclobacillus cellulosilyticus TaxID=1003997 RepID=A0A917KB54_9BACL|nr:IS110 family transposase [Alicyclobacillus cellulosilyticus]GGJ05146.1 IS110 family transposase [Alicyclobacillus cellulosilyticus]
MQVVYERCCGLDIHKRSVTACSLTPEGKAIRTFGTMTEDLLELADWLQDQGCSHVAMESTGSFWKPIYNVLEATGAFTLLVVNAQHIKAVPGRKTDVRDAEWIADLLRHGLLQPSFVPSREQRELRELIRYRQEIVDERAREVNRLQKVLEGANIKLSSVATDITGKSGWSILKALSQGETDPQELAAMAKGRMKAKHDELKRALHGVMGDHQRLMLREQLQHIEELDRRIERLTKEIGERMRPFEDALERLDTIPGVGRRIAEVIVAETGADMSQFPTAGHLASWAGMCPGNHESAGKRKSGRTRKGNVTLRRALVEAAQAAGRTRDTYLSAQFKRLAHRRGSKRAAVAVGHTILIIAYHLLKRQTTYQELGPLYFEEKQRETAVRNSVKRLERLGYQVILEPRIPA